MGPVLSLHDPWALTDRRVIAYVDGNRCEANDTEARRWISARSSHIGASSPALIKSPQNLGLLLEYLEVFSLQ